MCNVRNKFFKSSWAGLLAIVLSIGGTLQARMTQQKKKTSVPQQQVAVESKKIVRQAVDEKGGIDAPVVAPRQPVAPQQTGNLAAARERERELQRIRQSVEARNLGKAAFAREVAKQAERDGLDARPLPEIVAAPHSKSPRFTQTEAHLSLPFVRELVAKNYKVELYLDIVSEAIANEAKYRNSHYAFYNTTSNMWRLAQDLDTRLNARLNPTGANKQFKFLRFDDEFINSTAQGFLVNELKQNGLVDDNGAAGAILLSVNLSLFGNVGFPGECSWQYFVSPQGHKAPWRETYEKMMAKHGLTNKYIDELMKLVDIYTTKEDTLLQVLVPKDKVDEIGYVAWVKGIPAHGETISLILNSSKSKSFMYGIKPTMEKLTQQFAQEKESNPLYQKMMDGIQSGDFSLDSFLKLYCNKPWDLKDINDVTARLLFTPAVLGNPNSGVIVNRLSTVSPRKLKEYNDRLNEFIEKMVREKEAREDALLAAGV